MLTALRQATRSASLTVEVGRVSRVSGLIVECMGLHAAMGDICAFAGSGTEGARGLAEVVAVRGQTLTLMPFAELQGLAVGSPVHALGTSAEVAVGDALLGRVIDGFGKPLDGKPAPVLRERQPLRSKAPFALRRPRIDTVLECGVRSIDSLLTLGRGQRMGIFAGSGVGKSTLLGMMAKNATADFNVIALIGERGREVREFIEGQLGEEGLKKSVVVVATSDQTAPMRTRAAYAAVAIAEWLRDRGASVLLTMDSITRLAMARREIGLSAGEPPTARGYTPSVFSELPALCERLGAAEGGGSITGLLTVLVEGDDFNEPISDCLRATLDGHIVLSRDLAHQAHFPAIDVLKSSSRVMTDLVSASELAAVNRVKATLALLARNRQMIEIGAYEAGANSALDQALSVEAELNRLLRQGPTASARSEAMRMLQALAGKLQENAK
ncbi:MAG TPA: FliI/YscN family ATPase [Burkholderiaceae bacterium]|jgi:flagellum-specific ATP synthase